jgi:GntR family transcriptional regulator
VNYAGCGVKRELGASDRRRGRGITVIGTPEQSAVIDGARDLVELARRHGYRLDELVNVIHTVGG